MPEKASMTKIGKTYKDTANINQDAADVTEHFEEGKSAPEVRKKSKKIPKVTFSLMNPDPTMLATYVGGTVDEKGGWGYDGDEVTANKAVYVETEQGLDFAIPNGDIEVLHFKADSPVDKVVQFFTFLFKGLGFLFFFVHVFICLARKPRKIRGMRSFGAFY